MLKSEARENGPSYLHAEPPGRLRHPDTSPMKTTHSLLYTFCRARSVAVLLALGVAATAGAAGAARTEISLDTGWRFHFGETAGAETPAFADAGWSQVNVPHTWNAFDGQDGMKGDAPATLMKGDYARGSGWYRRTLHADKSWAGRQVYIQFDAASRRADVYINGQSVGSHLGGFARFRFDITKALRPDADNIIAVRVNNEDNGIIPQSADFTFFGGLYRDVTLLVTDPVQVDALDHGSPGVFLEESQVTPERAEVRARVELANFEQAGKDIAVRVEIRDARGARVQDATAKTKLAPGARGEVTLPLVIMHPHLWNGRADPYLYTARVEVSTGGKLSDAVEQPLGLRFFRVDPQQGFFLNGKYLDLRGVSRHQDRLNQGWALTPANDRQDFGMIAEMGCTAIRVAHYQQSPLWYRLADEQGLVLWSEIPFVNEALPGDAFAQNAEEQLRELIRQNYNHPAICFWGCGNENMDAGHPFVEGIARYGPVSEHLIQELNRVAHAEDHTRLTTYASFHSEKDVHMALPGQPAVDYIGEPQRWYTDVTAFNKYFGWYTGEPEDAAEFFDAMHARNPTQPIGVSEYGAGGSIFQHEAAKFGTPRISSERMRPNAFSKAHSEEYQAYYHEQTWKVFQARPYLWVKFIWNIFDFASDSRNEGDQPGRNDKGLVTFDRQTRKDAFYFYKANWSAEPVLYITSRRYINRPVAVTEVKLYTNAPAAELFLNEKSLGRRPAGRDHIVRWEQVTLQSGENRVRATAVTATGRALSDECTWKYTGP